MKDVLNDFKSCGRPMTKNEIKIKELEEDLDAEKSTSSNLARRILKAIEYIVTNREPVDEADGEVLFWLSDKFNEEDILKILKGNIK